MTIPGCVLLVLAALPPASGSSRLLDQELRPPVVRTGVAASMRPARGAALPISWAALQAEQSAAGGSGEKASSGARQATPGERSGTAAPGALDFDLLGAPPRSQQVDEGALRLRRALLTWHQGVGLGMFALQLATTVVGQLNYDDKFGGDNTGKYAQPHAILAYSTLATFVAAGTLALLAPSPLRRDEGFDRVKLHKLAMFTAAAGMAAQAALGIWTSSREGYLNQQSIAKAHLAIGYVTLAAVATGIGAIVF